MSFKTKDCSLIGVSMGRKAAYLLELCAVLEEIETSCIYYHFWGGLLRPRFDDPEHFNDFAI